jgi:hypothetical protein
VEEKARTEDTHTGGGGVRCNTRERRGKQRGEGVTGEVWRVVRCTSRVERARAVEAKGEAEKAGKGDNE